jgi:hypothetical protein
MKSTEKCIGRDFVRTYSYKMVILDLLETPPPPFPSHCANVLARYVARPSMWTLHYCELAVALGRMTYHAEKFPEIQSAAVVLTFPGPAAGTRTMNSGPDNFRAALAAT